MPWIQHQLIADGVTADGRVVVPRAILDIITNNHVATIAVNAGGTGYVVGEEFDIVGGTVVSVNGASFTARGRVTSVAAGVVTGVELVSAGAYSVNPGTTAIATTNASLAGNDDLTVNLTFQAALWTQNSSSYVDLLTNFQWLATSSKTSNPPTIGMQSQLSGTDNGMRLQIATSYDSGASWLAQPGSPPTNLFYVAVPGVAPFIYVSVTERRVNVLITDGTFKQILQLGLFIPRTDVDANYPFPGIAAGQSSSVRAFNEAFGASNRSIINPIDFADLGCYQYRDNLSTQWFGITLDNNVGTDVTRAVMWPRQGNLDRYSMNFAPVPTGSSASASQMDPSNSANDSGVLTERVFFHTDAGEGNSGPQGPQPLGVNNQLHFTSQSLIISNQINDVQEIGLIDGIRHVHGLGLAAFQEIRSAAGTRYLVFNDTNSASLGFWIAMEMR